MNVGEFFVSLGFDVDDKKLKSFDDGLGDLLKTMGKIVGIGAAAVFSINRFMDNSVKTAVNLRNVSEETGIAADEMIRLGNAAKMINPDLNFQNTLSTLQDINSQIAQLNLGSGSGEFSMLGINPYDISGGALSVLDALRREWDSNVQRWGERQAIELMKKIGVGSEWLRVIKASDEDFEEFWSSAIPTPEQLKAMEDMANTYSRFGIAYNNFVFSMSEKIAPSFSDFINFVGNKALPRIEEFAENIIALGSAINDFANKVHSSIPQVVKDFGGWTESILIVLTRLNPLLGALSTLVYLMDKIGESVKKGTFDFKFKPFIFGRMGMPEIPEMESIMPSPTPIYNSSNTNMNNNVVINTDGGDPKSIFDRFWSSLTDIQNKTENANIRPSWSDR